MSEQLSAKEYILLSEQRITKDITRCVRNLNVGECFEDFIAECEGVDSYVKDLEGLINLVFSKYSIEADLFENETLEDYKNYMETANACNK